jgi:FG-GAP-like repeat
MGTGLNALGEKQVNFSLNGSADGVAGTQADPAVTALSNGDFVVVYENPEAGSNIDLLAHFFDASGNAIGPPVSSGLLNGVVGIDRTPDATIHPAVAATPNGGFLVAYTDTSVTDNSIEVRRYDTTTGVSTPFVIDNGAGPGHQPNVGPVDDAAIAAFADGTSIVVWEFDYADSATDHDLDFAFLNSAANGFVHTPLPLAVQNSFEGEARVATSGNLAAIVYAADPGTINGGQDVILRLYNSSATEAAAPSTIFGAASSDVFSHPDVAALSDGRFVIVARDDTAAALVASIYDPVTRVVTPVNLAGLGGAGTDPHVAGVPGGGFVLSFDNSSGDVIEARFGPGGSNLFTAGVANSFTAGAQDQNAIAANASGTVFFAWQDAGSGNPNSTDTDTRMEAQAFRSQPLPQSNFNGDLHSDILWQNANGQAAIWEMNGTNPIVSALVGANPGPSWTEIGTGDVNDDGHSDILWQNANGQAAIWEMGGTSVSAAAAVGANPGPSWKEIGTGDFNGDGKSDILWQNTSGQAAIWEMNGTNIIGGGLVGANPGRAGRRSERATSTAMANLTSCGRTPVVRRRSGR